MQRIVHLLSNNCRQCAGALKLLPYRQKGNNSLKNNATYYQCRNCGTRYVLSNEDMKNSMGSSSSIGYLFALLFLLATLFHDTISQWLGLSLYWSKAFIVVIVMLAFIVFSTIAFRRMKEARHKIQDRLRLLDENTLKKYPELAYEDTSLTWTKKDFLRLNRFDKILVSIFTLIILLLFGIMAASLFK